MSKNKFYFSHDSNARNDEKILAVRMRLGTEGYGIYFMIIERLSECNNYMSVKDYNVIAFDLRVSAEKVKEVIENFGLFQFAEEGKLFYSTSLINRMIPLDNLREQRKLAGQKSAQKRTAQTENLNDRSTTVERSLAKNPTKERKGKERKGNEIINTNLADLSSSINFEDFKNYFNLHRGIMPEIKTISDARKIKIKNLVKKYSKEKIAEVILIAKESDFLQGNNKHNFVCSIDWILNPTNFLKILEGNYSKKQNQTQNNQSQNYYAGRQTEETIKKNLEGW